MTQFEKVEVRTRCPNGCKYKSGYTCVASECPYQTGDVRYDIRLRAEYKSTKINAQVKQAVKDFAEKVKEEVYPFLQAEMYNKKHFITGDSVSDKLLENQNIGILKAQDVLSKWFKVKIDELLKEF